MLIIIIANELLLLENETCDVTSNRAHDSTTLSSHDMPHCRIPRTIKSERIGSFSGVQACVDYANIIFSIIGTGKHKE